MIEMGKQKNQGVNTMNTHKKLSNLHLFVSYSQTEAIREGLKGEEKGYFVSIVDEVTKTIEGMPKTYGTDGQGDLAIAHLHYFLNGCDWYVTEKDMEAEQFQAFGKVDLGHGAELGYINIAEIVNNQIRAELDLLWTPKPLKDCK
jgi:hypothetical protein